MRKISTNNSTLGQRTLENCTVFFIYHVQRHYFFLLYLMYGFDFVFHCVTVHTLYSISFVFFFVFVKSQNQAKPKSESDH